MISPPGRLRRDVNVRPNFAAMRAMSHVDPCIDSFRVDRTTLARRVRVDL
jgi:hypothetical protein